MKSRQKPSSFVLSLGIHSAILGLIALFIHQVELAPPHPEKIELGLIVKKAAPAPQKYLSPPLQPHHQSVPAFAKLDLRPTYLKEGFFSTPKISGGNSGPTQEMLGTPFRVLTAFDHLAAQVDRNLDFPDLFVENGVQGRAVLDLHFDSEGKVDENTSRFSGSHHAIRGLLVKAVRLALVEWYKSDAYRLNKDQFKSQHFRTELDITYTQADLSALTRLTEDTYQITRRRLKNTCAVLGAVDLLCLAMKAKGAVDNIVSDKNRILFELLKDKLDHYDDIGLNGINSLVTEG